MQRTAIGFPLGIAIGVIVGALIGNMAFVPGDLIKAVLATLAARAVLAGYPMLPSRV